MNQQKRIEAIDIGKGIGILLVILGHMTDEASMLHSFIYSFHMPLFFFLSGMVITDDKLLLSNAISKQKRLMVSYFLYSVIVILFDVLVKIILLSELEFTYSVWELYQTLSFYGVNILWFLPASIGAKLLFVLLKQYFDNKMIVLISICMYVFSGIVGKLLTLEVAAVSISRLVVYYPVVAVCRVLGAVVFVALGYYCKKFVNLCMSKYAIWGSAIELCIVVFLASINRNVDYHNIEFGIISMSLLTGVIGSVLIISLSSAVSRQKYIKRILGFVGRNSVFIMVIHEYLYIDRTITYILSLVSFDYIIVRFFMVVLFSGVFALIIAPVLNKIIDTITYFFGGMRNEIGSNINSLQSKR